MRTPTKEAARRLTPDGVVMAYTVAETAGILGVSERTIREWLSNGTLRHAKIGGVVRITPAMIAAALGDRVVA